MFAQRRPRRRVSCQPPRTGIASQPMTPAQQNHSSSRVPRILIVDDDAGQRSLLDSFCRARVSGQSQFPQGEEALQVLGAETIDMMISDVRMPGLSGLETLRRARQAHAILQVLLVTAYPDVRDAVAAMRDGAVNYLKSRLIWMNCWPRSAKPSGWKKKSRSSSARTNSCPSTWWPGVRSCTRSSAMRRWSRVLTAASSSQAKAASARKCGRRDSRLEPPLGRAFDQSELRGHS